MRKNGFSQTGAPAADAMPGDASDGLPGMEAAPNRNGLNHPAAAGCPAGKFIQLSSPRKGRLPSSSPPEASFPQRMNRIWAVISPRVPLSFRAPALDRFLPSVRQPPGQEQPRLVSGSFPPETPRADHRVFRFGKPPCPFQRFPVPAERAIPDREGEVFRGLFRRPGRSSLIPQKKWHR